jgi:hypothetical protein
MTMEHKYRDLVLEFGHSTPGVDDLRLKSEPSKLGEHAVFLLLDLLFDPEDGGQCVTPAVR